MTNTSLSIVQRIDEFRQVSTLFAESGLFSDVKSASQCFVKIMAGAEMGIPPFTSMSAFHIIQGKVVMAANSIAARIKASGRYNYRVIEKTATRCALEFSEGGKPSHTEVWDVDRARKASVKNMDKYPDAMLFSRAISAGARVACPDVIGSYYTPEELGADVNADGEIIDMPAQVSSTHAAQATEHKAAAAVDSAPAAPEWKNELKQLGLAAKEWIPISSTEVAAELAAAQNLARDVLTRNGSTTEDERREARAALQAAIAKAEEAVPA